MTVFLCGVIIADDISLPQRLILASTLLIALANILPLTRWLVKKPKRR
jgi:hypothetical protein